MLWGLTKTGSFTHPLAAKIQFIFLANGPYKRVKQTSFYLEMCVWNFLFSTPAKLPKTKHVTK